jgi:hypothetical protein
MAMAGFILIGLGASNVVPVLFRLADLQRAMSPFAITTTGYAGNLVGPAGVGFATNAVGLPGAFWLLTAMLCHVRCCSRLVVATRS